MRSAWCWLGAFLAFGGSARAEGARAAGYSPYERRALDEATAETGHAVDPEPEGKRVEAIDVVRRVVFDQHDPAPDWLNLFHATTRDEVIRREVLLPVGAPFRQEACNETARNLRDLPQLSLVLCVATRGSTPDAVRVLVVTKDVWSLRLSYDVFGSLSGLEYLRVEPSETNLRGTHQVVQARYIYYPASHAFGLDYSVPRISGTRISAGADVTTFLDRHGSFEGTAGKVVAGQPLYATSATSAWQTQASWYDSVQRVYQGTRIKLDPHGIPIQYHRRQMQESATRTLSFGAARKHDFTFGAELNLRAFRADNESGASPADFAAFVARTVPVSETRVGPFLQYTTYEPRYSRVWDYDTLGLEENYRLGAYFTARAYPVTRALGSTHDFLGTYAAFLYTAPVLDGLVRVGLESTIEAAQDRILNGAFQADLHIASPRLPVGRLVFDAVVLDRFRNDLNRISYLGGDTRLRGYPSSAFSGTSLYVGNLEFRTRPVPIFTLQVGAVAFYDVGNAVDGFTSLAPRSAVGGGLRILLPQFNRYVFRADIAAPLDRHPWPSSGGAFDPVALVITFEQAFSPPGTSGTVGAPRSTKALGPTTGWLGQ